MEGQEDRRWIAGAMSGTSADGVDVAIVRMEGRGWEITPTLERHHHRAYPPGLRRRLFQVRGGQPVELGNLAELGRQISLVYAAAVNEALLACGTQSSALACVAAHGQTLYHAPPLTMQWLDPSLVAAEVGCAVVSDFRRADCAAGGQGAPLVPLADYLLFRDARKARALVNIGGIANVTYVPAGAGVERMVAFDTGPGNCVSDWLMRQFEPLGAGFDAGGQRALRGRVVERAVESALASPYFRQRPPKSTDGPAMITDFQGYFENRSGDWGLEDLLATACRITAEAIARAIERLLPGPVDEVIVSGGGTQNEAIMGHLRSRLGGTPLIKSTELGIPSEAKEAIAFALLGAMTLDGVAGNIPSATGARRAVILGTIAPKP